MPTATHIPTHQPGLQAARFTIGALARFATGLTWRAILSERGCLSPCWLRHAVADAEDRGLLVWSRLSKTWRLSPAARALVRSVP